MHKINKNESGFSAVEAVLIIVIVAIIGGVGWYVWRARSSNQTSSTTNQSTQASSNTIPSLKEATLATERLSFKYPSTWTLDDKTVKQNQGPGAAYDGDLATLTGVNGFTMTLASGVNRTHDAVYGSSQSKVFLKDSFTLDQKTLHIFYTGASGNGSGVQAVEVSGLDEVCAINCYFTAKNTQGVLSVSGSFYNNDSGKYKNLSLEEFKSDPNVVNAVAVIKSLHY